MATSSKHDSLTYEDHEILAVLEDDCKNKENSPLHNEDSTIEPSQNFVENENDPEKEYFPPRKMHWLQCAMLNANVIVGVGVLPVPSAFEYLGWLPAIILNTAVYLITTITGLYLMYMHQLFPTVRSYPIIFQKYLGKGGLLLGSFLVYTYMMFNMMSMMLTAALSLSSMAPSVCLPIFIAVAACIIYIIGQLRSLCGVSLVASVGLTSILVAMLLVMGYAPQLGQAANSSTSLVGKFGFVTGVLGMDNLVFAYAIHIVLFPFMAEMTAIEDFKKALWTSQTFAFCFYTSVGSVGYAYLGNTSLLQNPISLSTPSGAPLYVVNVLVIISMIIGATTCQNILTRYTQYYLQRCGRRKFRDTSFVNRGWWALWSFIVVALGYVITSLIPFFGALVGTAAALIASNTTFTFPSLFYYLQFRKQIPIWKGSVALFIILFGAVLTVLGGYGAIYSLIQAIEEGGVPFSCSQG
ncbi:amino acid transporter, AAAP family isoform 1 [Galdieria sulphuraria]|uniref:Amino acid transporter, AAAP family isoform 1 n=2 Tax=Galdieria sulphuraria TaxID=130081 RepID=M2XQW3_GALSU|nr:amino acid transporter, AAAP family isoform 1 [Galdieria sulphuraria]EME32632.1 amino acid transporter, AAAP family isoform 1 [Galdieria sulphuraria]|eukprot:XP_005709152.1 amino acid transporter, AAAP family isoform 1 [Galdieria sulphuraria]